MVLQAWAYDLQGREIEVRAALERSLALAYPGGFIRAFADLPPLAKVLHKLRKRRKARKSLDRKLDIYLQHLLAAMSSRATPPVSMEALLRQGGLGPLADRELGILCLLGKERTNMEIARELVVTPGTVKMHTNNVYRKLGVKNRRAAGTLAQALRSACWLLARPLRFLPADFLIRLFGKCHFASHFRKLYLIYPLWGIAFWYVFEYSDSQEYFLIGVTGVCRFQVFPYALSFVE